MHRDADGDPWYYSDIDPPEHVEADIDIPLAMVWINIHAETAWTRGRGTNWMRTEGFYSFADCYKSDWSQVSAMKEIMGYA
jgi:hypothetical protein